MIKTLTVLFGILIGSVSFAETSDVWCSYLEKGQKEAVSFKFFGDQQEIIQLRFKGPVPDRYFTLSKLEENGSRKIYTQFASRKNSQAFLELEKQKRTIFTVVMNMGGNHYFYHSDTADGPVECEAPVKNIDPKKSAKNKKK